MTVTRWCGVLAAVLLTGGCATTSGAGAEAAASEEFQKTGEVLYRSGRGGGSAAFSADRILGPNVNMKKQGDGSWGGVFQSQGYLLTISPGRIAGTNFIISYEETLDGVSIQGQIQGRIFRYVLSSEQLVVRTSSGTSMTLPVTDVGQYGPGTVRFEGEASKLPAQMPQLALALVAAIGS